MDFMADPEIKEWSEQMNQDPMDPTGAYDKTLQKTGGHLDISRYH
jgi:hypothetical protein